MKADPMKAEEDAANAAATAAAAAADTAAGSPPAVGEGSQPVQEPTKLPQGPSLSADDLLKRTLEVVEQLRTPADTEPKQVAQALDLALAPDSAGKRVGLAGSLTGSGSYAIEVWPLYGDQAPGQHVQIRLLNSDWPEDPRETKSRVTHCTAAFEPFAARIEALGFSGKRGVLYQPESWTYLKRANDTAFYVTVGVYRAENGAKDGVPCVLSVEISAARREDVDA